MVRLREHKHKRLTCHAVATTLVRVCLPAGMIATNATIMIVAREKEAAP
jgi:hypothetical protein